MNNATPTAAGNLRLAGLLQDVAGELRLTLESSALNEVMAELQETEIKLLEQGYRESELEWMAARYEIVENALAEIQHASDAIDNAINELEEVDLTW